MHGRDFFHQQLGFQPSFQPLVKCAEEFQSYVSVWRQHWTNQMTSWEVATGIQGGTQWRDTCLGDCVFRKMYCVLQSSVNVCLLLAAMIWKPMDSWQRLGGDQIRTVAHPSSSEICWLMSLLPSPWVGREPRQCPKQLPMLQLLTWIFPKCVSG